MIREPTRTVLVNKRFEGLFNDDRISYGMKYFVIFLVLIGFTAFYNAYAELDKAISEPFDNSDIVLVATVVQVTITPDNKTRYDLKVDEYLKGEKPFDLITAVLDDTKPTNFPKDPLEYFNKPYFEKDNHVFVYLKQDGSTFQMLPYSFTIKKPTVVGPPTVIHATGPQEYIISQGEEIVISGNIKKSYLYSLEKSGFDSSFSLVVLNENEEQVVSKKLDINLDGSYSFTFQEKDELRIPGKYSWDIEYHNGGMGGEFIVKTDQKRWTPLKQIQSDIPFNEIQCKQNLVLIQKYDGSPACVMESTKQKLVERGWTTKDSVNTSPHVTNPDISITNKQIPKSELVPVQIIGTTAFQICSIMGIPCPTNPTYEAMYDSKTEHTTFDVSVGINIYDFTLTTSKICYTIDGLIDRYCEPLDNSLIPERAGNNPTLLSKDVIEWENMSDEQLNQYHEYYGDNFYTELGRMLIKDRILEELSKQNIPVKNHGELISVDVSVINQSLPPYVYYNAIVNGTNGESYKFNGMTHSNKILEFSSELK